MPPRLQAGRWRARVRDRDCAVGDRRRADAAGEAYRQVRTCQHAGGLLAREVERRLSTVNVPKPAGRTTDADGDRVDRGLLRHLERAGAATADQMSRSRRRR